MIGWVATILAYEEASGKRISRLDEPIVSCIFDAVDGVLAASNDEDALASIQKITGSESWANEFLRKIREYGRREDEAGAAKGKTWRSDPPLGDESGHVKCAHCECCGGSVKADQP